MWGKKPVEQAAAEPVDHTAFIGEGSEIDGKYTFSGTLVMNGRLKGEIVSNDRLMIGAKGIVNATIRVGSVLIEGEVVGNTYASERVELRGSARVFGDIEAPVISMEAGVHFEGNCRMTKTPSRPAEVPLTPPRTRDLSMMTP